MGINSESSCLTVEAALQLAVSLLKNGEREWRHARDIHSLLEMDLREQPIQLPVDAEEFEHLLEKDGRFVAVGHGFFSLEGVEIDMDYFNHLISMGMYG